VSYSNKLDVAYEAWKEQKMKECGSNFVVVKNYPYVNIEELLGIIEDRLSPKKKK